MIEKKMWMVMILLTLWLITSLSAQEPENRKCRIKMKDGHYKSLVLGPVSKNPKNLFGFVVIKPKDVNREHLIQLARRLKAELCEAEKLQIVIVDKKKLAGPQVMSEYVESKGKRVLMRGFYCFDRKTGKEKLEFSTNPSNPTTEVQIDLSDPPDSNSTICGG